MTLGFEFRETMSGSYHLEDARDRERAMSFTIRARVHSLARFLRDRIAHIEGEVDLEGFADHRAMRGTLEIDPLLGKKLVYTFCFEADDGRKCRFVGQKTVEFQRLLDTMTTLPGEIVDDAGHKLGSARLRFDARSDFGKWLKSFKRVA
jgi:hypothetical protein